MNGTCPHHEWVEKSIKEIKGDCVRERGGLWKEINDMKKMKSTEYRLAIIQLMGIIGILLTVLLKG